MDLKTLLEVSRKKLGSALLRKGHAAQVLTAITGQDYSVCSVFTVHIESLMGKSLPVAVEKNGQPKECLVWCWFTDTEKALYPKGSGAACCLN